VGDDGYVAKIHGLSVLRREKVVGRYHNRWVPASAGARMG
jgi:hypothetical protein